ncbi:dienelactone hydrolase family protein [Caulobacter sp. S45]|uniref:dienelactone hydrolase family protein n=1 Tax=Caulobacter sp. S45 TaxID=1641861 RepID=UPI00131C8E28|nr:dienelactone hydrolase family protein [Caulobacter sp. S45]
MSKTIEITASDGHRLDAYVAEPKGEPVGALVMLQEFYGVNGHIRDMADQYAADGYHTIAPAIFDRVERGVELGYDPAGIERGRALRAKLDLDQTMLDVQAAIDAAAPFGQVAALGYCWGGSLAFLAGARLNGLVCAVAYYGAQIAGWSAEKPKVPVLMHFADNDEYIPMKDVDVIRAARPEVEMFIYPGTEHGFSCNDRQYYEPKSAALARERTLKFLQAQVRT